MGWIDKRTVYESSREEEDEETQIFLLTIYHDPNPAIYQSL